MLPAYLLIRINGTRYSFKKMKKFYSLIVPLLCPDPVLFWAYALPIIYWVYLTLTTNPVLVFDSDSYYYLANLFYNNQCLSYFQNGPTREPGYPLLVAISMHVGHWLGISYTYPLKVLCFGLLGATMIMVQHALKLINANRWIQAAAIVYIGLSPSLINSALCLYSEIAAFPWLIAIILAGIYFLRSLRDIPSANFIPAVMLGFCFVGFTLVKGVGEALGPLFTIWLLWYAWIKSGLKINTFLHQSKFKILLVVLCFYVPVVSFKLLNYTFNGNFAVTNRGEVVVFTPLIRRCERPITAKNSLIYLSTVTVSYPLCTTFFPASECSYWYESPPDIFMAHQDQLIKRNVPLLQRNKILRQDILNKFLSHPGREFFYQLLESLKMFFWETTRGAFVAYPEWLTKLFNEPTIVIWTSLGIGAFFLGGFFISLFLLDNELIVVTVVLLLLLSFLFSFFSIISRYTIMEGPMMVLINASCLSLLISKFSGNKKKS
jgi:hypothetical protein